MRDEGEFLGDKGGASGAQITFKKKGGGDETGYAFGGGGFFGGYH